jgi:hypothetical protein
MLSRSYQMWVCWFGARGPTASVGEALAFSAVRGFVIVAD